MKAESTSDTLRTDTLLVAWDMTPEPKVMLNHARQLERELNIANARIKKMQYALSRIDPRCEHLHHNKSEQHAWLQKCPVEQIINKAKEINQ